jgi:hypothetical protein
MRSAFGRLIVSALLVLCAACSSRRANDGRPSTDRNLITREQLRTQRFNTPYDAVEALRSNWLKTKGTDSFRTPSQVLVYLDDIRLGGVETLREIGIDTIVSIRYIDGLAATARWGLDHGQGVIFVSTRP